MNIAICDDEKMFIEELEKSVRDFFNNTDVKVKISSFLSGKDLLICEDSFDFVFLDIDMPKLSGMDVAEELNKYKSTRIIFVTNHDNLVYKSFRFQPIYFLRKSMLDKELPEAIQMMISIFNNENTMITLNVGKTKIEKKIKEIIYFEIFEHDITVNCKENKLNVYGTLSHYEQQLESHGFIRIHKSYLVNCAYIYSINSKDITLDSQEKLPLSKYKASIVKRQFHEYRRRY